MNCAKSKKLLLLFNHRLTQAQAEDARNSLKVSEIVQPPSEISRLWASVPPEEDEIASHLAPVYQWLKDIAAHGDFVLIQGDFGATVLVVDQAFALGLRPVYATTERCALEEHQSDGSVQISHTFVHVRFREYSPSKTNNKP